MITREDIRRIPDLHRRIIRKQEQLLYLREKATSVPSGLSDTERVQSSPGNSAGRYVDAAIDLNSEIMQDMRELDELKQKASLFINTLPVDTDTERLTVKILRYRYLQCCTWDETADILGYAIRYIQDLEYKIIRDL